ncbi:tub family protein-like protein [Novymonas esmeraldas]|uniref:Tub family protein-like protein n=1 Tax=Novymonas esmeraldas TaxID=1808958 RepID=A0AAW0F636_9TRYP
MDSSAYKPATPPRSSQPPPPPRGGGGPRFQRSHVVDGATATATAPPPPPRQQRPTSSSASAAPPQTPPRLPHHSTSAANGAKAAAAASSGAPDRRSSHRHHRRPPGDSAGGGGLDASTASDASDSCNAVIPFALTEGAVQRAFGGDGAPTSSSVPAAAAAGAARPGSGRAGGLIMPSRKEGSDAVSMYSMSQSVLPMDPRERIYYRPRRHLMQCYLERRKLKDLGITALLPGSHKSFQFFLEHTNDFVLAAVPRSLKSRTMVEDTSSGIAGHFYPISQGGSNIVFTINQQQLDGDTRSFVGKLSRRGSGLEMVMFSEGSKATRKEILAVLLDNFADSSRSAFTVVLPAIDPDSGYLKPLEGGEVKFLRDGRGGTSVAGGSRAGIAEAMENSSEEDVDTGTSTMTKAAPTFAAVGGAPSASPGSGSAPGAQKKWRSHGLLAREYRRHPDSPNIVVLKNKAPQWDGVLRGYKLDFHGRATKASEKNFQLVAATEPEKVIMLFGKQSDDRFAIDFRYPLCGLQAAAIATTVMTARKVIT